MISIDTNILLYAQNADCRENAGAMQFIHECSIRDDIVICELVLVELYILLRNPIVVSNPLAAKNAIAICQTYRENRRWRLVENAPVMNQVWSKAGEKNFARRRIIDARLAFTLLHHGVSAFATSNTGDFEGFGFKRVWNPIV